MTSAGLATAASLGVEWVGGGAAFDVGTEVGVGSVAGAAGTGCATVVDVEDVEDADEAANAGAMNLGLGLGGSSRDATEEFACSDSQARESESAISAVVSARCMFESSCERLSLVRHARLEVSRGIESQRESDTRACRSRQIREASVTRAAQATGRRAAEMQTSAAMTSAAEPLYPLELAPIYKRKVWGGRRLERLGRVLPGDAHTLIGESWELADLAQTSSSGAGGGAERSVIANGPLAGSTLQAAWNALGSRLFPRASDGSPREFPLLVKLLDARQNLSLQVHPTASYVRAHPGAFTKSEAWYVIDAEPGAVLYKGVHAGVRPDELRRAARDNDVDALVSLLITVPAHAGDCHYLPSGTLHALGAGIVVAEVENPSDTTYRIFDWGRKERELHVEQALQCTHFGPCDARAFEHRAESVRDGVRRTELAQCPEFQLSRVHIERDSEVELPVGRALVWMVLAGAGSIGGAGFEPVKLRRAQTLLLPAEL